ncbi:hypothetical protein ABIA43_000419 [Bradyrhizobium sp. USDA 328]|jgi:hypothetical protein
MPASETLRTRAAHLAMARCTNSNIIGLICKIIMRFA